MNNNQITPLVSVIMGIFNCADTLEDAVKSIINQTFHNWELILCDDGSTDSTFLVAKSLAKIDKRIIVLKNESNKGLNYTLNHCLEHARGEYVARMDGDDLCSPDRFSKQLQILEENPEISIVSSDMNYFDENGIWGKSDVNPRPSNKDFMLGTPFCHAPCMVRKCAYDAVNGYSESKYLLRVEDYHLWIKMYSKGFKGLNLKEPLYSMRDDRNAYSRRKFRFRINESYVKGLAYTKLNDVPFFSFMYILKPLIVGLIPNYLYDALHKWKLNSIKR